MPGGSGALACTPPVTPTPPQAEGPYWLAGAPQADDLVQPGMAGTPLVLTGFAVDQDCVPLPGTKVEIWQADAAGTYDNAGFRLRGYVLTDASGRYTIRTIVPGEYPGRTEHIHVKVTPPGGSTLTTQLYFPGDTTNDGDGIYDPALLLEIAEEPEGLVGTFTFAVAS
jgi:protocatechuate 3,4-dioxygenase beta subunit